VHNTLVIGPIRSFTKELMVRLTWKHDLGPVSSVILVLPYLSSGIRLTLESTQESLANAESDPLE
jgi:hypothetical protein